MTKDNNNKKMMTLSFEEWKEKYTQVPNELIDDLMEHDNCSEEDAKKYVDSMLKDDYEFFKAGKHRTQTVEK
jgi:polyhydroxyalkanoate synthesis regulator phasin